MGNVTRVQAPRFSLSGVYYRTDPGFSSSVVNHLLLALDVSDVNL